MAPARRSSDAEPFAAINITPMIDVLLVLIVMLVLTIPIKTYKVPIELPQPEPSERAPDGTHRLDIARNGALAWDGRAIADGELTPLLDAVARDGRQVLHMRTHPETRYERFDQTLATVKRANITRLGFVGDAQFADWDR